MNEKPTGFALFGLGRIGQVHIKTLNANRRVNLLYVVDQNEQHVNNILAQQDGGSSNTRFASLEDIDKVLADDRVEAVVICTPTDTHVDLTIKSLKAGKHVMCEKPLAEVTADISRCYDVADQNGKVLFAAFNRRFDASYRKVMERVRNGDIGELQMVRSVFRDAPLWLGAHTFTQTFLCHDIDILCWFADSLPESVSVMTSVKIKEVEQNDDVDVVIATMKFPNGMIGVLDFARYSCYGYDIRLEALGSKGMLKMEPVAQSSIHEFTDTLGERNPPISESFFDRFKDAYFRELEHFINVTQGKEEVLVPRAHCERTGLVMDALIEAHKTNQTIHLKKRN